MANELTKLSYNDLLALYKAVREEIRRRSDESPVKIKDEHYGKRTDTI